MTFDPALSAMMAEPWSNNACRGYVIYAMENCGFSSEDIRRVVGEPVSYTHLDVYKRQPVLFPSFVATLALISKPELCKT